MPVANPIKTINVSSMNCSEIATVTMGFESAASLAFKPADIVLIMDRSSSMTQDRMNFAKAAANQLIDIVDGARDGATRMGIVSFGNDAKKDVPLTTDFSKLKSAISALNRGGYTNHKAAFEAAADLLNVPTSNRQVVIMFTDGVTTASPDPNPAAQALKDKGVEIFCIGLAVDPAPLNLWATDPDITHVAYTDDPAQLDRVFKQIAAEVILAGAMDVEIKEQLMPDFKIVNIHTPHLGNVDVIGPQNLTWKIDATGIKEQPDMTTLSFDIMYTGSTGGLLPVNHSVIYTDREGNTLDFPSPTVEVNCSAPIVYPDKCPNPTSFNTESCQDAVNIEINDTILNGLGRIVQVNATLKNICPGKRVAVAVILTEINELGEEFNRGMKIFTISSQEGTQCQDISLRCVKFVIPEDLDIVGEATSICNKRTFNARVIANYLDTDFVCCDSNNVN